MAEIEDLLDLHHNDIEYLKLNLFKKSSTSNIKIYLELISRMKLLSIKSNY